MEARRLAGKMGLSDWMVSFLTDPKPEMQHTVHWCRRGSLTEL